jgi:hypothetical protein
VEDGVGFGHIDGNCRIDQFDFQRAARRNVQVRHVAGMTETRVARDDVLAIRAYLATIEPVSNKVVSNQLPFPFRIRALMLGWNLLNFDRTPFHPDPNASFERNRGAYLVDGLGHCGT